MNFIKHFLKYYSSINDIYKKAYLMNVLSEIFNKKVIW